ncbi:arginine deiminase family protein [Pseudalkalibacillus hwajinpoensis]|uniref:Arginine deiminase n=1 Tax=Guptibacillus hwajinpoensis TaxID=208199 RepID=A0A4U1M9A9_9BACL|nr:arginine deiminase family protein [Pseudalkalibacillus hwajinpoensis]TKD67499.1 arginine deiminase [Pseudalkalibacillus hwajinpoensis]
MNIHPNCWNESDELKTVVVCSPSILDVPDQQTATDVQWEKAVKQKKARRNHEEMVRAMEEAGVTVIDYSVHLSQEDLKLNEQLLNRVFVRDLACVFGQTILPGAAGTSMRRPEYFQSHRLFQQWFNEETFRIRANNNLKALEYGDVMVLNKNAVFINTGIRTSIESIEALQGDLFEAGFSEIGIIDLPRRPDTMHLDMNCNVAGENLFLGKSYMSYLPVQVRTEKTFRYQMAGDFLKRHGFEVEWTSEIKHTVADINFLNLDPETLLISTKANKSIFKEHSKLKHKKLIEVDVDELENGGGGIRCMTLPLERNQ